MKCESFRNDACQCVCRRLATWTSTLSHSWAITSILLVVPICRPCLVPCASFCSHPGSCSSNLKPVTDFPGDMCKRRQSNGPFKNDLHTFIYPSQLPRLVRFNPISVSISHLVSLTLQHPAVYCNVPTANNLHRRFYDHTQPPLTRAFTNAAVFSVFVVTPGDSDNHHTFPHSWYIFVPESDGTSDATTWKCGIG